MRIRTRQSPQEMAAKQPEPPTQRTRPSREGAEATKNVPRKPSTGNVDDDSPWRWRREWLIRTHEMQTPRSHYTNHACAGCSMRIHARQSPQEMAAKQPEPPTQRTRPSREWAEATKNVPHTPMALDRVHKESMFGGHVNLNIYP